MTSVVPVKPRPIWELRKSAAVSPTVVAMILMTQKKIVTSGTLLSMRRATGSGARRGEVIVMASRSAMTDEQGLKGVSGATAETVETGISAIGREGAHRASPGTGGITRPGVELRCMPLT